MSGTLRYTLRVTDTFGTKRRAPVDMSGSQTIAGDYRNGGTGTVVHTGQGEAVPTGDVATPGRLYLQNDSDTNNLDYGPDSGGNIVVLGSIPPGQSDWISVKSTAVVRVRGVTASVPYSYELWSA